MPSAKAIISLKTLQYLCDEVKVNKKEKLVTGIAKISNETKAKSKNKSKTRFCLRKSRENPQKRHRSNSPGHRNNRGEWTNPSECSNSNSDSETSHSNTKYRRSSDSATNANSSKAVESATGSPIGSVTTDETNGSDSESVYESE